MKTKRTIQQRLILPIVLLGVVALISNVLAVIDINNVNSNASRIVDHYMVGERQLAQIRQSVMNIHKLALSHIVATDYGTMVEVVTQIKEAEAGLDEALAAYEEYALDPAAYQELLEHYDSFKHILVHLLCASADSKTQEAYALANGEVASCGNAIESSISTLYEATSTRTAQARRRLLYVYAAAIGISVISVAAGVVLVLAAVKVVLTRVVSPIRDTIQTLKGSSERITGVVGEVLERARSSDRSTRDLSVMTQELSAAIQEVADNASVINGSADGIRQDVNAMAEECGVVVEYSVAMKARADELEQSARTSMEVINAKVAELLQVLGEAIDKSRSVDQISTLTKDILGIASSTNLIALNAAVEAARVGAEGKGFAVVAREIRQLADSCGETAGHIQQVNEIVTSVVNTLSANAQELVDYLNQSVLTEFQEFVHTGEQYRSDAAYIHQAMDAFNSRAGRLQGSMTEITGSIGSISSTIEESAAGIAGAADSTRSLAENMADITGRMSTNQEIVEELREQMEVFADL